MSKHATTQEFRLRAIDAEVNAIKAQAKALSCISLEHHDGVDIGCNSPVDYFKNRAQDLADSLKSSLSSMKSAPENCAAVVEAFEKSARALQTESAALIEKLDAEAARHLAEQLADTPKKVTYKDIAVVPDDARDYKVSAHKHCCAAETTEIRSFVQQIAALCELCLETLCVEAETATE